jgi:hypothetical protein
MRTEACEPSRRNDSGHLKGNLRPIALKLAPSHPGGSGTRFGMKLWCLGESNSKGVGAVQNLARVYSMNFCP